MGKILTAAMLLMDDSDRAVVVMVWVIAAVGGLSFFASPFTVADIDADPDVGFRRCTAGTRWSHSKRQRM